MAKKYLEFEQDGVKYNLYDMPDGFVIKGDLDLEDLEGCGISKLPDLSKVIVEGNFNCGGTNITNLKGSPKKVGGNFWCDDCTKLKSLKGAPREVGGSFICEGCSITDLEGAPKVVGGNFYCRFENYLLSSLQGAPQKVGGKFDCNGDFEEKYGLRSGFSVEDLHKSPLYIEEKKQKKIDAKLKDLRNKVMRTIAAENVSPQKGVTNKKRPVAVKKGIKRMLDGIGKSIDK